MKQAVLLASILAFVASSSFAAMLTFDEVTTQPADGLTVNGVSFTFEIGGAGSDEAIYNSELLLPTTFLDDHVLSGPRTGALGILFGSPVISMSFGVALNTLDSLAPGVFVELFGPNLLSLGTTSVTTDALVSFSEGQFNYAGAPVRLGVVTFTQNTVADAFAIDNLQFEFESEPNTVPEPSTFALFSGALLLVARFGRRSR